MHSNHRVHGDQQIGVYASREFVFLVAALLPGQESMLGAQAVDEGLQRRGQA
jgi:hypothetical protein